MKYRRDYTVITNEDIKRRIHELVMFDRICKKIKDPQFYKMYVLAEKDANIEISADLRKRYRAQQVVLERKKAVDCAKTSKDKIYIYNKYEKSHPWLKNTEKIKKLMSLPGDPEFHYHGDEL